MRLEACTTVERNPEPLKFVKTMIKIGSKGSYGFAMMPTSVSCVVVFSFWTQNQIPTTDLKWRMLTESSTEYLVALL